MLYTVGVPKEIKNKEGRVGLTPDAISTLTRMELATVVVEKGAGLDSGYSDEDYIRAGADIATSAEEVYKNASLIVKVKEITAAELPLLQFNQTIYTFLHAADNEKMVMEFLKKKILGISYDTMKDENGGLPILKEMSIIAGEISVEKGLELKPGLRKVAIVGCGIAGCAALRLAFENRLEVTALDINAKRLEELATEFPGIKTFISNAENLKTVLPEIDLLVGAVLIPGAPAPKVVTREMVKMMKPGSMIVDISIDQGGCIATSRPTTHDNPTFVEEGVTHYCVTNMPGSKPQRSTPALVKASLPYLIEMLKEGFYCPPRSGLQKVILTGINTFLGFVTNEAVAKALSLPYKPVEKLIKFVK